MKPTIRRAVCACVVLNLSALPAFAQSDSFKAWNPTFVDAIFSAVNGERSGYLEAEMVATSNVYVQNQDPTFNHEVLLRAGATFHLAFEGNVETVDADGRKRNRKVVSVVRAGPGEQIAVSFRHYSGTSTSVTVTLLYFDESGNLVGRTAPIGIQVYDSGGWHATAVTFGRRDLRR